MLMYSLYYSVKLSIFFFHVDTFSKVRLKLREAEENSQTDLNTAPDELDEGVTRRSKRNRASRKGLLDSSSGEENDCESLIKKSSLPLPKVPVLLTSPPLESTFAAYQRKGNSILICILFYLNNIQRPLKFLFL